MDSRDPPHTKWDNPSSYRGELNGAFPDPNERVMKRKRISSIILATNTDIYTRQRRLGPRPVRHLNFELTTTNISATLGRRFLNKMHVFSYFEIKSTKIYSSFQKYSVKRNNWHNNTQYSKQQTENIFKISPVFCLRSEVALSVL